VAAEGGSPSESSPYWRRPAYAWYVTAILLVAFALSIVDRISIGLLVDDVRTDLQLSDTQMGPLQGFAFADLYTLAAIPVGYAVDRYRRTLLLGADISVWSLITVVSGCSRSLISLFLARVGVGLGESTMTPAASSLISDYFPPAARPRAFGMFRVGDAIASGLAYLLASFAIQVSDRMRGAFPLLFGGFHNWQMTLIILGRPGLLLAPLLLLTVREPVRDERASTTGKPFSFAPALRQFSRQRLAYLGLMVGGVVNVAVIYAQYGWLPTAFNRSYGWSPRRSARRFHSLPCPAQS